MGVANWYWKWFEEGWEVCISIGGGCGSLLVRLNVFRCREGPLARFRRKVCLLSYSKDSTSFLGNSNDSLLIRSPLSRTFFFLFLIVIASVF